MHKVFARIYRPQTFEEVVGQDHVITTLKNAIKAGKTAHAYLFAGPHGVGKTTIARIFAKALNCREGPTPLPCGGCESCLSISKGEDVDVIEIDAASNRKVEDARILRESVFYLPLRSRYKIYIIDEAHMLTEEAFNTLLKTLEEPPGYVKFFFATTEPSKMLGTIVARCQRFDLRALGSGLIKERLRQIASKESINLGEDLLWGICRSAEGSIRDALTILEQLISYKGKDLTLRDLEILMGCPARQNIARLLKSIKVSASSALKDLHRIFAEGVDGSSFVREFIHYLREILVLKSCGKDSELLYTPSGREREELYELAERFSEEGLLYFIQLLFETNRRIKEGINSLVALESVVVKMSLSEGLIRIPELLERLGRSADFKAEAGISSTQQSQVDSEGHQEPILIEKVKASWQKVISELRAKKVTLAALLAEGRPYMIEKDELVIIFPREYTFHKMQLELPANRKLVESAIEATLGRRIKLQFKLQEQTAPRGFYIPEEIQEDPMLKKVLESFDGKIISIREKGTAEDIL